MFLYSSIHSLEASPDQWKLAKIITGVLNSGFLLMLVNPHNDRNLFLGQIPNLCEGGECVRTFSHMCTEFVTIEYDSHIAHAKHHGNFMTVSV